MSEKTYMEFNEGHITEGLDRCHTIAVMIEELLSGHPAVVKAGAESDIQGALAMLVEAYQKIGWLD